MLVSTRDGRLSRVVAGFFLFGCLTRKQYDALISDHYNDRKREGFPTAADRNRPCIRANAYGARPSFGQCSIDRPSMPLQVSIRPVAIAVFGTLVPTSTRLAQNDLRAVSCPRMGPLSGGVRSPARIRYGTRSRSVT